MSGGNCPETPRQKMIGMMYLFLTAMLALNVSSDLLKAFLLVDESIQASVKNIEKKNSNLYRDFEADAGLNPRAEEQYLKMTKIKVAADSLANHIIALKWMMIKKVDSSKEATLINFSGLDNQDISPQLMITEQGGGRSELLKKMFSDYKEMILAVVDPKDSLVRNNIIQLLSTPDREGLDERKSWQGEKFEHLPLAATLALMSKMVSDVRNAETDVLRYLAISVDESSIKFTSVEPLVIPRSEVVIRGGEYSAQLIVAGQDENLQPEFTIAGLNEIPSIGGKGQLKIAATSIGEKKYKGNARILGPDGWIDKPFEVAYEVIEPLVVMSPTKMNVFYEAVDNPLTISVPGVNSKDLTVKMTNATFRKDKNQYLVTANPRTAGMKSVITVTAKIDDKMRTIGSMEFRIKRIPPPIAKVGGISEGKLSKALLVAQTGVVAVMEEFDFELTYTVSRFTVSAVKNGYSVEERSENNRFTAAQQELIKGMVKGNKIFINEIVAVGPDKTPRKLGGITITID